MNDKEKKKIGLDHFAIIISFVALAMSILSFCDVRKHNRLSLKPHINFLVSFTEDKNQKDGIYLVSNGPGPAIIKEFKIFVDDIEVDFAQVDSARRILNRLLNLTDVTFNIGVLYPNNVIQAGTKILIIGPEKNPYDLSLDQNQRIASNFKRLKICVKYNSLYEKKDDICEKNFQVVNH